MFKEPRGMVQFSPADQVFQSVCFTMAADQSQAYSRMFDGSRTGQRLGQFTTPPGNVLMPFA